MCVIIKSYFAGISSTELPKHLLDWNETSYFNFLSASHVNPNKTEMKLSGDSLKTVTLYGVIHFSHEWLWYELPNWHKTIAVYSVKRLPKYW